MHDENIICVLLHGVSGSGKSETARGIAAPHGLVASQEFNGHIIHSDVKALAEPLVAMHRAKLGTKGASAESRQLWLLHRILTDLFPMFSVDFSNLMELVYDLQAYPLKELTNTEGDQIRDRDFMTWAADSCHSLSHNIFVKYLVNNIGRGYKDLLKEHDQDLDKPMKYLVVVPDLRLEPELNYFQKNFSQLITIKLNITPEEQEKRIEKRDGVTLTPMQKLHPTQASPFPDSVFDLVINSDTLALDDQIEMVKEYIFHKIT